MKFTRVVPDVDVNFRFEQIDSATLNPALLATAQKSLRQLWDGRSEWVYGEDDQFVYTVALGAPALPAHPSTPPGALKVRQSLFTSNLHFHIRQQTLEQRDMHVEQPYSTLYGVFCDYTKM